MPKTLFTQEEIDNYVKEKTFHLFYKETVAIEKQMCVHADGIVPEKMLFERRPNEPLDVMTYRKIIFSPKTKSIFLKVFSSLQKIRRSSDWSIRYEGEFPKIREGETLEDYCEHYYPGFYSLTNWVFTLMLRKYLIDPNAVVFVAPVDRNVPVNEFLKPIAQIFDSKNVIDFVGDDFAVLVNPIGATYMAGNKPVKGKSYYVVTTMQTLRYDQINGRMQFALGDKYDHNLGYLPCFKLKGILVDQVENMHLYESRIGGIIPELDEAIREYSDLQAAKVLHMYPERWEFTQNECTACKGNGQLPGVLDGVSCQVVCNTCKGQGYVVAGPYSKIMVKPAGNPAITGVAQIPTPPAGFVEKDVEIIKIMEESVERHIYNALAAINFEFLAEKPLATSGIKTAMDGDEMNNTVHGVAEDLVAAMDNIYWLTALYRYKELYPADEIIDMIPEVQVPEKFDILSSSHLQEELKSSKEAKFNPVLLNAMEKEYATKKFNTSPEVSMRIQLILTLDPFPNVSEDDKMIRLSNKGITLEDYIISSNIQEFVQRAIDDNKGFEDMELEKQKEVLSEYAGEVIKDTETIDLSQDAGIDAQGNLIGNAVQ